MFECINTIRFLQVFSKFRDTLVQSFSGCKDRTVRALTGQEFFLQFYDFTEVKEFLRTTCYFCDFKKFLRAYRSANYCPHAQNDVDCPTLASLRNRCVLFW